MSPPPRRLAPAVGVLPGPGSLAHARRPAVPQGVPVLDAAAVGAPPEASATACANAFAAAAPDRDLALVVAGSRLPEGWLARLERALGDDPSTASASALTDAAGALSVAGRAAREGASAPTPLALGPCVLLRRSALQLAGAFDEALGWDAALVELSQRCVARGLTHALAGDLFVSWPPGGASALAEVPSTLAERHPQLPEAVAEASGRAPTPARRLLDQVRRGGGRLSVTIDGRALSGVQPAGTQVHALELVAALARTRVVDLRVVVPPDPRPAAARMLAELGTVELLPAARALDGDVARTDVVHRPQQIYTAEDLALVRRLGERLVVSHLDSILYANPAYFADPRAWRSYRRITRLALAHADRVLFLSRHALEQARREELVQPDRGLVVPMGVDHRVEAGEQAERAPAGAPEGELAGGLLCLGTDLRHKNRPFALRLAAALRDRHGWNGPVVLAGPHVAHGSSREEEERLLAADPRLAGRVRDLGAVGEQEKRWLLRRSAAVLYPTVVEGFGLVPFEATLAGAPCLFAAQGALGEELPGEGTLVPWDVEASAEAALPLLVDREARRAHVEAIVARAREYTWDRAAEGVLEAYAQALEGPPRAPAVEDEAEAVGERELALREVRRACATIGEDGLGLVGPDGLLPPDVQRALLALAARPALRAPLFGVLRLAYRAGHAARRP